MMPIFRHLLWLSAACSAPAAAQTFEDLGALEARVSAALGAGVGEPGGPSRPIDRRLRLAACPQPVTVDAPVLGAAAVRCEALGWRIRVPVAGFAAPTGVAAAPVRVEPIIRRGDQVQLIATTSSFTVSTSGVAEQDGAPGDRIRVRTERRSSPVIGRVTDDGRVALPGFN